MSSHSCLNQEGMMPSSKRFLAINLMPSHTARQQGMGEFGMVGEHSGSSCCSVPLEGQPSCQLQDGRCLEVVMTFTLAT
jgi:hypothetical protein